MASILIVALPQLGHIGPTLALSARLIGRGHAVSYLADSAFRASIERTGASLIESISLSTIQVAPSCGAELNAAIGLTHPDLLLLDLVVAEHYLSTNTWDNIPHLLFSTSLLDWNSPLGRYKQSRLLVLCPESFEHPAFRSRRAYSHYVEPFVMPQSAMVPVAEELTDTNIVLCTFGTQSIRHVQLHDDYMLIFDIAEQLPDVRFVLGAHYRDLLPRRHCPNNLTVHSFIEQQAYLAHASAFITHGGLGSVKEAILTQVPMLVLPRFGDQFFNAMRVRHHELGAAIFPETQTLNSAVEHISRMLGGYYRPALRTMFKFFSMSSIVNLSLLLIEEALEDT
jgi:UDP:flavonoid glycosyltransferase YjiC (YdhE family)